MKAKEFAAKQDLTVEAGLALAQMGEDQEVNAETLVKGLFEALKTSRNNTRMLDSLLLACEGELPEKLRGMGIDCSDDEVLKLVDQFGRNYCW